jgi:hypothetical protein
MKIFHNQSEKNFIFMWKIINELRNMKHSQDLIEYSNERCFYLSDHINLIFIYFNRFFITRKHLNDFVNSSPLIFIKRIRIYKTKKMVRIFHQSKLFVFHNVFFHTWMDSTDDKMFLFLSCYSTVWLSSTTIGFNIHEVFYAYLLFCSALHVECFHWTIYMRPQ